MIGDLQGREHRRGDLIPVLMRDRDDEQIDLLGFHSRALVGRYKPVRPIQAAQVVFHSLALVLLVFAYGYLCWHLGRHFGRHEQQQTAEAP